MFKHHKSEIFFSLMQYLSQVFFLKNHNIEFNSLKKIVVSDTVSSLFPLRKGM